VNQKERGIMMVAYTEGSFPTTDDCFTRSEVLSIRLNFGA
jgi:hypothetical protein